MSNRLFLFLAIVFVYSMYSAAVNGAENPIQDGPQLFTNQDVEKYKSPSDAKTTNTKAVLKEYREDSRKSKNKRIMEEREMEFWCKKASAYKKKIKEADEDVKVIEKEISEEGSKSSRSSKKTALRQKKLEKATKRLKGAEADLGELEQEAHRKGVKPGWLRCQL